MEDDSSNVVTDACPNPRESDVKSEQNTQTNNTDHEEKPSNGTVPPFGFNRKKTSPIPFGISVKNSSKVHIGPNTVINIGAPKPAFNNQPKVIKTERITKLLSCDTIVTEKHIKFASEHIGESWKDVGRTLDFSNGQLEQIYMDNFPMGMREVIYKLLLKWIQRDTSKATLGRLGTALWNANETDCVQRLSDKYI